MGDGVTGGDLFKLWQVANVHMPRAAKIYTEASGIVNGTSANETAALSRGPQHMERDGGVLWAAFIPLRNEFQYILAQTGQNLLDAQNALNKAIEMYCSEDATAATEFKKDFLENPLKHDPSDPTQNPPTGPYKPTDPVFPPGYHSPVEDK